MLMVTDTSSILSH